MACSDSPRAPIDLEVGKPELSSSSKIRVVLITIDTLRYDSLRPGDAASPMPLTAARAKKGQQFTRFFATTSITQPSHASMFTGLYPWQHGVSRNGQVLDARYRTLTEQLKQAGFETAAAVASFPLAGQFGFDQGFDRYSEDFQLDFKRSKVWEGDWQVPEGRFFSRADTMTEHALKLIDAAKGSKQFFWFHYFDPHAPYGDSKGEGIVHRQILRQATRAGANLDEILARVRNLYREDVAYLDRALERLFLRLDRDSDAFETHIFLLSDHGESLGEAFSVGHGMILSDEQLRIPAFILSPALEPAERGDVASSVDVARTLLSLAGVPPPDTGMGGRDLSNSRSPSTGAFGMRKTFAAEPPPDLRLDGKKYALPARLFYAADSHGRVFRGNASGLDAKSRAALTADTWSEEGLLGRFREFENQLDSNTSREKGSPDLERALEALGYVR